MSFSSLPPWLLPALIVHVALFAVLLAPTWRAFAKAGTGGAWALVLILPGLGLLVVAVLLGASTLRRAGWSPAWAILAIIPLVNVVFLWLFAYGRWTRTRSEPIDEPATARREPRMAAVSARVAAAEPTLKRPTDDGYEGVDPHNRGLAEEIDTPPAVGDLEPGEQTMIAGVSAPEPAEPETPAEEAAPAPAAAKADAPEPEEPEPEKPEPEAPAPATPAPETPTPEPPRAPAEPDAPDAKPDDTPATPSPTSDEMALAAGVLSDLEAAAKAGGAPPVARGPGDEERTVPMRPAEGARVWTLRGVNARSANIEVIIREEDLSQSDTGILVGRSSRVDFIIGDESVSRNHARFVYHEGALCVEDLDSMNGTWVDGAQLDSNAPVPVADQSEVEFGKIKLLVTEAAS